MVVDLASIAKFAISLGVCGMFVYIFFKGFKENSKQHNGNKSSNKSNSTETKSE